MSRRWRGGAKGRSHYCPPPACSSRVQDRPCPSSRSLEAALSRGRRYSATCNGGYSRSLGTKSTNLRLRQIFIGVSTAAARTPPNPDNTLAVKATSSVLAVGSVQSVIAYSSRGSTYCAIGVRRDLTGRGEPTTIAVVTLRRSQAEGIILAFPASKNIFGVNVVRRCVY